MTCYILLFLLIGFCFANNDEFPKDFLLGISSSAYQIEGAWNESGKGENIWDKFTHEHADKIDGGTNSDVACDAYHKVKEDVQLLKDMGVQVYRFSLSWSRILPTGYVNKINPDGIRYYNELINELIQNKIKPVVTLYHFDLPVALQEYGGWTNPFIVDYFVDYARVVFEKFGDRVKYWITVNEPYFMCQVPYVFGLFPPAHGENFFANYMCSYTVILAHAKVFHMYDQEFRHKQKGKIGITFDSFWYESKTEAPQDIHATELAIQTNFGWFAHAIFSKTGDYPPIIKEAVANLSVAQSLRRSRLPIFTPDEITYIRGSADFLGLNHYTTYLVRYSDQPSDTEMPLFASEFNLTMEQDPNWDSTSTFWIKIVPWGLRKLLNWIKEEYHNPEVYILENGVGDTEEILNDRIRVKYLKSYLGAVLDAIHKDGCNVKAYSAWCFMDDFEWVFGYKPKFGLYHVDFNDPHRKRTSKASAVYYS